MEKSRNQTEDGETWRGRATCGECLNLLDGGPRLMSRDIEGIHRDALG